MGGFLTPQEIDIFFSILAERTPTPAVELNFTNPYTLLVAVVLSAQATDVGVNKATPALFEVADSPQKMLILGEDALRDTIKTIGLYRTKAANIIKLSHRLISHFGGEVPDQLEDLESLAGVGRKTANVVLSAIFGKTTIPVDTHVFRVSHRTGLAQGKTPEAVEAELMAKIPQKWLFNAANWLVLHGRYICKAKNPACSTCPVRALCPQNMVPKN